MRIDHVIYATRDLDVAAGRLERELGLVSLPGGRHEGLGTHNRIVPLGGGYLELLGVADLHEAAASDFGRGLLDHLERAGDGLLGWVVAVDDASAVAWRLGTAVTTIRRSGLSAHLAGLAEAMREPFLPFFISRDEGIPDPGAAGEARGITWIELSGDAGRLEEWVEREAAGARGSRPARRARDAFRRRDTRRLLTLPSLLAPRIGSLRCSRSKSGSATSGKSGSRCVCASDRSRVAARAPRRAHRHPRRLTCPPGRRTPRSAGRAEPKKRR